MARRPRLSIARHPHLVLLRGHNGQVVFQDVADRVAFLTALRAACLREHMALHGYALPGDRAWILCTPAESPSLSRAMQSLGRRFAAGFNQRHGRTGSLWDGRFRAAVVERGPALLEAMVFVDQCCQEAIAGDATARSALWSSARQHLGHEGEFALTDAPEFWSLGNTPFERASAYASLLEEPQDATLAERIAACAEKGWAYGSPEFVAQLERMTDRPVAPRPRGRPRKGSPSASG